jgi:serine/threonine protein kinase
MILLDERRRPVRLGHTIGQGGEAAVYQVEGRPELLAKIFVPGPRPNYEDKLAWMIAHPPENPTQALNHASLAWPLEMLYGEDRTLKGYLMPYIRQAVPALIAFNPRRRARVMPAFDRRYLFRAARNLATSVASLHLSGYVVGDLNESNALVNPSALVTLIDTDSFQVQAYDSKGLTIHYCPVGKLEYTPPELQGKPLQDVTRLPEHDSFALSVLIFQLLVEGSHPFRAQWLGSGEPPALEVRIRQGLYPYMRTSPGPVRPPKAAPSLDHLHPQLVELFHLTFAEGHKQPSLRPSPQDWRKALREAEKALRFCARGHTYSVHQDSCPFCSGQAKPTPVRGAARRNAGGDRKPAPRQQREAPKAANPKVNPSPASRTQRPGPVPARSTPRPPTPWSRPGYPSPPARQALRLLWRVIQSYPLSAPYSGQPAPAGASAGTAAQSASKPIVTPPPSVVINQPGRLSTWLRPRLQKSLLVGSSTGALAGSIPGALLGMAGWTPETIALWTLIWAVGGAAAGVWRGWRPANRMGEWLSQMVGWERFWTGVGTINGAVLGTALGLIFWWAIFPVVIGFMGGIRLGAAAGRKIWQVGSAYGWERIIAVGGSLITAAMGAGFAWLIGSSAVGGLTETYTAALMDWIFVSGGSPVMTGALTGALGGALGGAATGFFSDLAARLAGLID